jgi:hypothetical protein
MDFFARDVPDMGYQPGSEIMASLLPVVTQDGGTIDKSS